MKRTVNADPWCHRCCKDNDQLPYAWCSRCYTPHPRVSKLFPGIRTGTRAYYEAYRAHQQEQASSGANTIVCCNGEFHPLITLPDGAGFQVACCGRILTLRGKEP